jgi:inorganic pyrophosphatase
MIDSLPKKLPTDTILSEKAITPLSKNFIKLMRVNTTDFIGKTIQVKIDRPLGTRHPSWHFIYPVNYGYIPNVQSTNGEELDAYILGVFEPLAVLTGQCIAVIHRSDDNEDKLVLTPPGKSYTDDQIYAVVEFQERFFKSVILRAEISEQL